MTRACAFCGNPFEAKRSTAKYCGSSCRSKASTGAPRPVQAPAPKPAAGRARLAKAVSRDLEAAGRLDSVLGQQAVALAERIDLGATDTGSAIAALSKELRAVMEAALADAKGAADPLDELRARRERKSAGG
jgi:hypothetical protein